MVNKKEMPQAGGTAQRGKDNLSRSNYSTSTTVDTITIPLAYYIGLIDTHQPEKYQRDAEKLSILRRMVRTKLQEAEKKGYCAGIDCELLVDILGIEE